MDPQQLKNVLAAAKTLGITTIPILWLRLIEAGWEIQPTTCECGGKWAWLDPMGQMYGCVCHNTPATAY